MAAGLPAKIMLGNVHATLFDRELIEKGVADFVVRGEAELGAVQLAEHLEHPGPGMVLLRGVQRAAPEVWQAVEPMLCGGDRRLQRQILALEAEHRTGAESVGFLSRQGAGSLEDLVRREVLGEARLLSERVEVVLLTEAEGTEVLL